MSRDFTPDFVEFREPSPGPRESSSPSPDARRSTERTRGETPRPEARSAYVRDPRPKDVPSRDSRAVLHDRYRGYNLRESEIQTLTDLGKFRVINAEDLARHGYGGDRGRMERETERLMRQGLVEEKRFETSISKSPRMYTLTKAGRRLMQRSGRLTKDQEIYAGLVNGYDWSRPMTELEPAHQRALQKSGIEPPFRLYNLRHTYGTRAVEASIDLFSVAKLMGHADLSATQRYVHLSKGHLEDAQKKIERFRARQRSL